MEAEIGSPEDVFSEADEIARDDLAATVNVRR